MINIVFYLRWIIQRKFCVNYQDAHFPRTLDNWILERRHLPVAITGNQLNYTPRAMLLAQSANQVVKSKVERSGIFANK